MPVLFWQLGYHCFRHLHIVEAAEDHVYFMEGMEILLHGSMEVGGGTEAILGDRLRVKIVVNLLAQQGGIGVIKGQHDPTTWLEAGTQCCDEAAVIRHIVEHQITDDGIEGLMLVWGWTTEIMHFVGDRLCQITFACVGNQLRYDIDANHAYSSTHERA